MTTENTNVETSLVAASGSMLEEMSGAAAKFFTTLPQETPLDKAKLMNCLQAPDFKTDEIIGKTFMLKNFIAQNITMVNEETGEITDATRLVLISEKGKSVVAVSKGLFNSVKMLIQIFGLPGNGGWKESIPVMLAQLTVKKGRTFNLKVVTETVEKTDKNVIW